MLTQKDELAVATHHDIASKNLRLYTGNNHDIKGCQSIPPQYRQQKMAFDDSKKQHWKLSYIDNHIRSSSATAFNILKSFQFLF